MKGKVNQQLLIFMPLVLALLFPACTYNSLSFEPDCEDVIVLDLVEVVPSACDQLVGSVEVKVIDETLQNLEYAIDGTNFQSGGLFENLAAGTYTITARNADCEGSLEVIVQNGEGLNATAISSPASCGDNTGSIQIIPENASGTLSYSLDGGQAQGEAIFVGLAPGTYSLSIEDGIGCVVNLSVDVGIDIEYATIESFINTSCALSGCHAGNVEPDFRVKDNILNNANRIRSRTTAQSMPPSSSGQSLTPAQIEAIQCWVDNGAEG